jgi:hypothetical protein
MVTFHGHSETFCDGISRRNALQVGALGMAGSLGVGIGLDQVLRARDAQPISAARQTSVIFIELAGGPTQFETYDPKPNAPKEYRGAFGVAQTTLPGVFFSEWMPRQAEIADKLAVVRSIHHPSNSHDPSSHLTQTGYYKRGPKGGVNQMPAFGCVVAKLRGSNVATLPPYVAVPRKMRNGGPAHLGKSYNPFETVSDPSSKGFKVQNLALNKALNLTRLGDRRTLLGALDAQRRLADLQGAATAVDDFTYQAFDLITGDAARVAFDIEAESASVRDAYGRNSNGQGLLLARRLVEHGVTCVTVRVTGWDNHTKIADALKKRAPSYDQGAAALVSDLYQRGMADDVLVVSMGEFGRTPRVNKNAGRDHWGSVMSVMLAGGGLQRGIVGASNSRGEVPAANAYRPENVLAMIYRHLGIDPEITFDDFSGRPRHLLERRDLIKELV